VRDVWRCWICLLDNRYGNRNLMSGRVGAKAGRCLTVLVSLVSEAVMQAECNDEALLPWNIPSSLEYPTVTGSH
jgi:hypothetical protein